MAWVNIEDLVAQQQVRIVTLWRLKCLGSRHRATGASGYASRWTPAPSED